MHTFVPSIGYARCASELDLARLNKQRIETIQILDSIVNGTGYVNHPVNRMWIGYEDSLVMYGLSICHEWRIVRGHSDSTWGDLAEWMKELEMGSEEAEKPPWVGDLWVHRSHRSNLIRKAPHIYGPKFPNTIEDMPYLWPHNDHRADNGYVLMISRADVERLDSGERFMPAELSYDRRTRVVAAHG